MVGVAGKSKGCKTCRKRKIACDQQRPVCAKCIRSNRVCGGYQKDTVFVLVQPASRQTHTYIRSPSNTSSNSTGDGESGLIVSSPSTVVQGNASPNPLTETSVAYQMLNLSIESDNLFQVFMAKCFPSDLRPTSQSWIFLLGELPSRVQALEASKAAVAASAVGHMLHDDALIKQSLNYYTRGLHLLQKALRDPDLMLEDGTLAACMALSLYEALECPNTGPEGYFNHCSGLIALIRARGQNVHSSGAGHRLFLGFRVSGIVFALNKHTTNIFSESAWVEKPWKGLSKTSHDLVVDCLAQAPAILERVRSLLSLGKAQQTALLHELISECWRIDSQLNVIYDEMQRQALDELYWPVSSRTDSRSDVDDPGHLFPIVYCFKSLKIAATLMLLWATRTMLLSGLANMYQFLEAIGPWRTDQADFELALDLEPTPEAENAFYSVRCSGGYLSVAHQVCRSVDYFLQDEMLLAGPLSVGPSLGIVLDSLQNRPGHDQEVSWIKAALMVARRKGLRILEHAEL